MLSRHQIPCFKSAKSEASELFQLLRAHLLDLRLPDLVLHPGRRALGLVQYLAQALKQTSREATVLLYAPALDPHLQKLTELADRVFCIYSEQAPAKGRKAEAKMPGDQRTLEAYS